LKYEMTIHVSIRQDPSYTGGSLQVSETLPFDAENFGEICGVLTRYHELAEAIRALKEAKPTKAKESWEP